MNARPLAVGTGVGGSSGLLGALVNWAFSPVPSPQASLLGFCSCSLDAHSPWALIAELGSRLPGGAALVAVVGFCAGFAVCAGLLGAAALTAWIGCRRAPASASYRCSTRDGASAR